MNPLDRLTSRSLSIVQDARDDFVDRFGEPCVSEHVGDPLDPDAEPKGRRVVLHLRLRNVIGPFPGDYGDRYGYIFNLEGTCHVVMWWSGAKGPGIAVGDADHFRATIIKHGEHEGAKQTIVSRVKRVDPDIEDAKKRRDVPGPHVDE